MEIIADDYDWNLQQSDEAVGIDLGTTFSCVSVYKDGRITVIPDESGKKLVPSVVAFSSDGKKIIGRVGRTASENMDIDANHVVSETKRLIGRKFDDPAVQANIARWPFQVKADKEGKAQVTVCLDGKRKINISPPEVSARVLIKLKRMAEKHLGKDKKVTDAVITVPAYFNNLQREATQEAAKIAGLNIITMINEPSAAALAYGIRSRNSKRRNVLVLDIGGGTSDVALIRAEGEKYEVIICKGDSNLGGEDFDTNLVNYCVERIENSLGIDVSSNPMAMRRLRSQCQFVKCKLSENPAEPNYEYLLELDDFVNSNDVKLPISRKVFEELNQHLFDKAIAFVPACLEEAQMAVDDIDHIVPVGGSMRIPKLKEMLQNRFREEKIYTHMDPDVAIAIGAAVFAAQKMKIYNDDDQFMLSDITPYFIGVKASPNEEMIVMIPKNSPIPCQKTKIFAPMDGDQGGVVIEVYQGISNYLTDNDCIGKCIPMLQSDLSPNVNFEVTFNLDSSNCLKVTAKNVATGNVDEKDFGQIFPPRIIYATSLR